MTNAVDTRISISLDALAPIQALYDAGLYLQAFRAATAIAPLQRWTSAPARVLAARLAGNLGNARLARAHQRRAFFENPGDPQARYFYARALLERSGPLPTLRFIHSTGDLPDAPPQLRAEWFSVHATIYSLLRDVDRAEELFAKALALAADHTWILVERADAMLRQDRYAESLAFARDALALRAWFRPAVQTAAHILTLMDKDDEALDLLAEAGNRNESGMIVAQLASLQTELGLYPAARANFERLLELWPIADKHHAKWLLHERADAAYRAGDFPAAMALAAESKEDFYKQLHKRLADMAAGESPRRVHLSVGFVRQHQMTCAPATIATLCRYWNRPEHEHLAIAEKICYDGTPQPADRAWANDHGFITREFTVTWDAAVALLDRGVPFMLCTIEPGMGHAQAIIGYDTARQTLLVRDPYLRNAAEFIAEKAFERYRSTGPRGLVILPADRATLLDGLSLPDADLHEHLFAVQTALEAYDRPRAAAALEQMRVVDGLHRLTHYAARCLAAYDSDIPGILSTTEALLALYPDDLNIQLTRLTCLRDLARRDERVALLKQVCTGKNGHPLFWQRYAAELLPDARAYDEAYKWIRKSLRAGPYVSSNYRLYAELLWSRRKFDEAFELYRFAACLDDKDPDAAGTYFSASLHFRRSREALEMLRARFDRFAARSSVPSRLLFRAYEQIDQTPEAFALLEAALERRPEDGDLLLFAADAHARYGRYPQAETLLRRASGKTRRAAWLFSAANLADMKADLAVALALHRELLTHDPLSADAHRAVTRLLMEIDSRAAAIAHLRAAVERFPNHLGLREQLITILRDEDRVEHEEAVRAFLALYPDNPWALREHALALLSLRRDEEAIAAAEHAKQLAPDMAATYDILGYVLHRTGHAAEARRALEHSLTLSVDNGRAIGALIELCKTTEQRRDVLGLVRRELVRQVIFGDGLLAFRDAAAAVLPPLEVLAQLREAHAARADLWHSWSAVIQQLIVVDRKDEAIALAKQACERFPLLPKIWLDRAEVHAARNEIDEAIAALNRSREISPNWGRTARMLAELYDNRAQFSEAAAVLRQAITCTPLDPVLHAAIAPILWKLDDSAGALSEVERALVLAPGYDAAWNMLRYYAQQLRRPELPVQNARGLTEKKPGDATCWLVLARMLPPTEYAEGLAAAERAIALAPRNSEGHDLRACFLTEAKRYEEAIEACRPAVFGDPPPPELRARAGWVISRQKGLDAGAAAMEEVLAADCTNPWAWHQLANWYRSLGRNQDYRRVAQRMLELFPRDTTSLEFMADACLRTDDRPRARELLEAVLARNPDSGYTVTTLIDMAFTDNRLDDAGRLVEHLAAHHVNPDDIATRRLRLAIAKRDPNEAAGAAATLARSPSAIDTDFDYAAGVYTGIEDPAFRNSAVNAADFALRQVLEAPQANDGAAGLLIRILAAGGRRGDGEAVLALTKPDTPAWRNAMFEYIAALVDGREVTTIRRLATAYETQLRADARLWSITGWAFGASADDHAGVAHWYRDWRSRSDVSGRSLLNLANAYRELKRFDEAHEAGARALELADDNTHASHLVFLAADAILRAPSVEQLRAAARAWAERLEAFPRDRVSDFYQCIFDLVRLVQRGALVGRGERGSDLSVDVVSTLLHRAQTTLPRYKTDGIVAPLHKAALRQLLGLSSFRRPVLSLYLLYRMARG